MYRNYTIPCGRNDIVTYDGTNQGDIAKTLSTTEGPNTQGVVIPEKCESNAFIKLDGQILNI